MQDEPGLKTDPDTQPRELTRLKNDEDKEHLPRHELAEASTEMNETSDKEAVGTLDWEQYRTQIVNLYQSKPLEEVQRTLREQHGLEATLHQYESQIAKWRVKKIIKHDDMQLITPFMAQMHPRVLTTRSLDEDLLVGQRDTGISRVKHFAKRQKPSSLSDEILPPLRAASFPDVFPPFPSNMNALLDERRPSGHPAEKYDMCKTSDNEMTPEIDGFRLIENFDVSTPVTPRADDSRFASPVIRAVSRWSRAGSRARSPKRKRSISQAPSKNDESSKMLACPFNKYDPIRYSEKNITETHYRKCAAVMLTDIPRLKQHLYRAHDRSPNECPRCLTEFKSSTVLDEHMRQEQQCMIALKPSSEKMTEKQKNEIKKRQVGKDDVDNWYEIWSILFPESRPPDSPYIGNDETDSTLQHFINLFKAVGPDVSKMLQKASEAKSFPTSTRVFINNAMRIAHPPRNTSMKSPSISTDVMNSTKSTVGSELYPLADAQMEEHKFFNLDAPNLVTQDFDFELGWQPWQTTNDWTTDINLNLLETLDDHQPDSTWLHLNE